MFTKKLYLILLLLLSLVQSYAQKKYVYTSVKLPLGEYIAYLIDKGSVDIEQTEGALFDLGYSVYNSKSLAIETGIEYFIINPFRKTYYHNSFGFDHDELDVKNSAFAFQIKPVWKIGISEENYLRISNAINYQKLYSSGKFYRSRTPASVAPASAHSVFKIGLQPAIGFDFVSNEKLAMGLDIAYIKVNWNESMQQLTFSNQSDLVIPSHRTSNVFISLKFMFK